MQLRGGFAALLITFLLPWQAFAQAIILDAEFSEYANTLIKPLRSHMPHTEDVAFVLVPEDSINAFVTGERVVYVHGGLFLHGTGSSDIQGVLAHEMGHISSQHILRMHDNARTAVLTGIAGAVVGLGAAVAGAPQVAAAAVTVGQAGGIAQYLRFSRTQEQEADQRAIGALHAAGLSAQGMVNTFDRLRVETQLSYGDLPPYLLTHPLPEVRLQSMQRAVAAEKTSPPAAGDAAFKRMEAKIYALTHTSAATLRRYPDKSEPHRYARALAYTAQGKLREAETELTPLIQANPKDVFYREAAAQIELQRGNLARATTDFEGILRERPDLLLIRYQLAETLRAADKPAQALGHYRQITRQWPIWADPWYGMGITYGQTGELALSHLALAQAAIYSADKVEAAQQLAFARNYLTKKANPEGEAWAKSLDYVLDKDGTNE